MIQIKKNLSTIIDPTFNFKDLEYQRLPDFKFDYTKQSLLGEMYNDKIDNGKNDLSYLNINKWKNFAWCFYKLPAGRWVPPHKDHFANYSKFYNITNKDKIKRTLVFLEDWKPGHVFVLDDQIIINWKANDSFTWNTNTEHWGGNFGEQTRYTLQLTGTDDC